MKYVFFISAMLSMVLGHAQTIKVKAAQGDGIFSLLRKQGLDPVKYYTTFLSLNEGNIKNGSELHLGREYLIPDAPDSFKKMAVTVDENLKNDRPIFDKELAQITAKSDHLQNAVLYLVPGINGVKNSVELKNTRNEIMKYVAQELMVHGARVYLIEAQEEPEVKEIEATNTAVENTIADRNHLEYFVSTINKHSLQHSGKYQRVLVLNFNDTAERSSYYDIGIFHHKKSDEGEQFAMTLQDIFNQKSLRQTTNDPVEIFENTNNLYLIKNVLPSVTMIDISGSNKGYTKGKIAIPPEDKDLADMITNGVLTDYAKLSIEK